MVAGNTVHITGSDVLSHTGTAIVGKNVTIDAAVGSTDIMQTQKQSQAGINVGIGGAAAQLANAAYYGAQRGSEVQDDRLKALYAAQAAYQARDAYRAAQSGLSQTGRNGGINLQIGIGGSSASSTTTSHDDITYGSHIRSTGDVTIAATGGDLNLIGSQIDGHNVALAAANNLNLLSQEEHHTLQSTNKNASGGVGLQLGTDGFGVYLQGSMGRGHAHGNGVTHTDSTVNADGTLTLVSGHDTTIRGAQLTGNTVLAAIGHNLLIQSEQDTDDYASKQWQAGGKVVIGMGGGSGSLSYNQSKVNSHYASVTNLSGIRAGDGGFDITVGGTTQLIGGVIASSADQAKNILDTGSLRYESIHNDAHYSASSVGLSASYQGGTGGYGPNGFSSAPLLGIPQKGHDSSDTNAGIAQGTIIQRDGNTDLSGLDRNPTLDSRALAPIFDAQKVQENVEASQVAGYVGMRTAGSLADYMASHAATDADKASWSDGGTNKAILHGLVGAATAALGGGDALQGGLGAAGGEAVSKVMSEWLWDHYHIDANSPEGKTLMALASVAVGGAVGGGNGAATALQGELYNRQLHQSEKDLIKTTLAKQYAAQHPGMSEDLAGKILESAALVMVDDTTAGNAHYDPVAMQEAQSFLKSYALSQGNVTIGYDPFGQPVPLFGVSAPYQRQDSSIFGSAPHMSNGPEPLGWKQVGDWGQGFLGGALGSLNPGNIPDALNATLLMLTDPQSWLTGQQQGMANVFYQAQHGDFGPAGQTEGSAAGNAALQAALGYGAWKLGGANAAADALKTNVLANIAESQAAREASGFEGLVGAEKGAKSGQSVPPSILGVNGNLPPGIGGTGTPISMQASANPSATAEQFAQAAFNGQTPVKLVNNITGNGSWVAIMPDGTAITYRPAGQASSLTSPTTATVEINSPSVKAINNGNVAKFKFPSL